MSKYKTYIVMFFIHMYFCYWNTNIWNAALSHRWSPSGPVYRKNFSNNSIQMCAYAKLRA